MQPRAGERPRERRNKVFPPRRFGGGSVCFLVLFCVRAVLWLYVTPMFRCCNFFGVSKAKGSSASSASCESIEVHLRESRHRGIKMGCEKNACQWGGCGRQFDSSEALLAHVASEHIPLTGAPKNAQVCGLSLDLARCVMCLTQLVRFR